MIALGTRKSGGKNKENRTRDTAPIRPWSPNPGNAFRNNVTSVAWLQRRSVYTECLLSAQECVIESKGER